MYKRLQRILARAFCLALFAATAALAGPAEWKQLVDQIDLHLQAGSFEQAELFAREALKEAEATYGPNHRATASTLGKLVFVLRLRSKTASMLDESVK